MDDTIEPRQVTKYYMCGAIAGSLADGRSSVVRHAAKLSSRGLGIGDAPGVKAAQAVADAWFASGPIDPYSRRNNASTSASFRAVVTRYGGCNTIAAEAGNPLIKGSLHNYGDR